MSLKRCLTSALLAPLWFLAAPLTAEEPWLDKPFAADPREILRAAESLKAKDDASVHVLPATGAGLSGWGRKPE